MVMFDIESMQLKDQNFLEDQSLVFRTSMRALAPEQLLIPPAARLDVAHCNQWLWPHLEDYSGAYLCEIVGSWRIADNFNLTHRRTIARKGRGAATPEPGAPPAPADHPASTRWPTRVRPRQSARLLAPQRACPCCAGSLESDRGEARVKMPPLQPPRSKARNSPALRSLLPSLRKV